MQAGRIYELGGTLPYDIRAFADRAGCPDAYLPGAQNGRHPMSNPFDIVTNVTAALILEVLVEAERCAIRTWSEICDLTFGKDPRTYDMAARILNEEVEHEACERIQPAVPFVISLIDRVRCIVQFAQYHSTVLLSHSTYHLFF